MKGKPTKFPRNGEKMEKVYREKKEKGKKARGKEDQKHGGTQENAKLRYGNQGKTRP